MPTVGNIAGRPYLNISIFATLYQLMGRSQQDLLDYMEATLYMQLPAEVEIPLIDVPRRQVLPPFGDWRNCACASSRAFRRLPAYLRDTPAWFAHMRQQLAQTNDPGGLLDLWQGDIRPHILDGVWTVLGTATYSADYTLSLRRALTPLVGDEDAGLLIANLSGEGRLLASLEPLAALGEVAEGRLSRAVYLERFGHRGPDEFELSLPRPAEDPEWLDGQIARFQAAPVDIRGMVDKQRQAFEAAWERFAARYPSQVKAMQRRVREVRPPRPAARAGALGIRA